MTYSAFKVPGLEISQGGTLTIPFGTTANRPNSPKNGFIYLNTDTGRLDTYLSGSWKASEDLATVPAITAAATPATGQRHPVDTTAAELSITLKDDAIDGERVEFFDPVGQWATNPVTFTSNDKINGSNNDLEVKIERGGISFVRYLGEWVQYGASGTGGDGSGIGIVNVNVVTADTIMESGKSYLVDNIATLTIADAELAPYNGSYTRGALGSAASIPAAYNNGVAAINNDDDVRFWTRGTRMIVRHPTTKLWLMLDSSDAVGVSGWYRQTSSEQVELPTDVYSWDKLLGDFTSLGTDVDNNLDFTGTPINLTMPASPEKDHVCYIADLYGSATRLPFNVLLNGAVLNSSKENLTVNVNNGALETHFIEDFGWKLVRGMGFSQGESQVSNIEVFEAVGLSKVVTQTASGDLSLDLGDANAQAINADGDVKLIIPSMGAITAGSWMIKFQQDAKGGRRLTFSDEWKIHQGLVAPKPNAVTIISVFAFGDGVFRAWLSPEL